LAILEPNSLCLVWLVLVELSELWKIEKKENLLVTIQWSKHISIIKTKNPNAIIPMTNAKLITPWFGAVSTVGSVLKFIYIS
jgi:hypothetical protein